MKPQFVHPLNKSRTDNDRIIVNCGVGNHYPPLSRKVKGRCAEHEPDTWQLFYIECLPDGCPEHDKQQYAFKIFACEEAVKAGFRYLLWMDCTFHPVAPITPIWNKIEEQGWWVPGQGDSVLGHWASDAALEIYGISREEALKIRLVFSGLVGLDLHNPLGKAIWEDWKDLYQKGAFNGPHYNKPNEAFKPMGNKFDGHVSSNPAVQGHRHDESALAFILHKHGQVPSFDGFLSLEMRDGYVIKHGF